MLAIDHVIYGARDLEAAAQRLYDEYGLASVPGVTHEGWGTANRFIPLGRTFIELLGVVNAEEATESPLGKWLEVAVMSGDRLIAWGIATDRLDKVAKRMGLSLLETSRTREDGVSLSWRSAGFERVMADNSLPFFITWTTPPEDHPGRIAADHKVQPTGIEWIEVVAPKVKLKEWLGGEDLPVRVEEHGSPRLQAVGIGSDQGEIVLR
jgi:Glyoxalase-like domain